jgi:oligo-1,6-glucosidase
MAVDDQGDARFADAGHARDACRPAATSPWWKDVVVYQIYPRSFNDSNGDGIGDLPGITAKLDYLKTLGIDVIWLSPHFDSPNVDNGYDVRDYRQVMPEFGTMADFDRLVAAMRERGMRLIIDLVANHTSDQHRWFQESRRSPDNPYRDYYIWRPGRAGARPPNNYPSFFGGSAWQLDAATGAYYLHYFAPQQPDLNWENPQVRAEVADVMRFWLDRGVAGFRMDVIPLISKPDELPDLERDQLEHPHFAYASGPRLHDHLRELNRDVLAPYDAVSVGEAIGVRLEDAPLFVDARRRELSMLLQFDIVRMDRDGWRKRPWTLPQLKALYTRIDGAAGTHGWNASFLGNHDSPRAVSHFGDEDPRWRALSAKALMTLVLTQRATPFLYQGDELGMTNYPFERIEQYDDLEARGLWRDLVETGRVPASELLAHLRVTSRDHARTPMQWSAAPHGGFTTATPWLAVNPNFGELHAQAQLDDDGSVYHHCRRLIALRRRMPGLVHGAYRDIDPEHPAVFGYTRALGDGQVLVLIHFGREPLAYPLPHALRVAEPLLDNGAGPVAGGGARRVTLAPWQATLYRCA